MFNCSLKQITLYEYTCTFQKLQMFQTGGADISRASSRMGGNGDNWVNVMNMLNLLLPGTTSTYYGEELGMRDMIVPVSRVQDRHGRDPQRTPMQWSDKQQGGFTSNPKPWLPVNPEFMTTNMRVKILNYLNQIQTSSCVWQPDYFESLNLQSVFWENFKVDYVGHFCICILRRVLKSMYISWFENVDKPELCRINGCTSVEYMVVAL